MKNETTNYKGFTPPTLDEINKYKEYNVPIEHIIMFLERYDILTPLGGGMVHLKTSDENLFKLYMNDEMTEEDTWLVLSQMNEWKEMIKKT